jgi:uncharacterized protein YceK
MRTATNRWSLFVIVAMTVNFLSGCGTTGVNQTSSNSSATANSKANVNTTNAQTDAARTSATCTPEDDKQIVAQIRILIDGDAALRPHRNHINYSTKICKVTLRGWVDTFENFKKLYDKVSNAGGVRSVDISGFELRPQAPTPTPGGTPVAGAEQCPDGTKRCGELCVPNDEDCTIQTYP